MDHFGNGRDMDQLETMYMCLFWYLYDDKKIYTKTIYEYVRNISGKQKYGSTRILFGSPVQKL